MNPLKVRLTNNNAVKEPTHKECRYMQNKNCGSTPSLLRSKEVVPNMNVHLDKENNSINLNSFNRQSEVYARLAKSNSFDQCRSLEFGKRIKTVENDDDTKRDYEDAAGSRVDEQSTVNRSGLINIENNESQILTQPARGISISSYFNGETFGLPSRTGRENLSSSREFMEEKKMKNEVLDQLIHNNSKQKQQITNFKEDMSMSVIGVACCVNHGAKKAKYRLLSRISEGEDEMFYCSKCAVNLLQQGFKVEELKNQPTLERDSKRLKQITRLETKMKFLEDKLKSSAGEQSQQSILKNYRKQMEEMAEQYDQVLAMLNSLKQARLEKMNEILAKQQCQNVKNKEQLWNIIGRVVDIRKDVKECKSKLILMKEKEFGLLAKELQNKIGVYENYLLLRNEGQTEHFNELIQCHEISSEEILSELQQTLQDEQYALGDPKLSECTDKLTRSYRQLSFDKKDQVQDFSCNQAKKPFRNLFPEDAIETLPCVRTKDTKVKKSLLQSVREYPTFGNCA